MKCHTRKYFFQLLKYFFSIRVLHTAALRLSLLKSEKYFANKRKNLSQSGTDASVRFDPLRTLGAGAAKHREIMKPARALV